ncbi:hypothetical protein R70006_03805 [Paraburkholderia domus]|uniref:BPSL0761 family protein n=1 Tax=Paraburkholderia domus TaxID=2793075 RepID=UPI0019128C73|nr:BPSL0761 family protein [Paraburkholderia domus]MBK5047269.1 hypothetical protein [Burkholderia sp. R-70006]CAE6767895.1 hypothetical protein R70006_03805 [Paraburkholderia domus]
MTMPDERTRALICARELLLELSLHPERFDARQLQERAGHVLRHYPDDGLIAMIARESIWLDRPRRV